MASGYIDLPVEGGGGGTGNILSINGSTAANQFIVEGDGIDVVSGGGITTISFVGPVDPATIIGTSPSFAFFLDPTGELGVLPGWNYYTNTLGANVILDQSVTDTGGLTVHNFAASLIPTEDSPSASYNLYNLQMTIDPTSTGFDLGAGGSLGRIFNVTFSHQGTSDIGALNLFNSYGDIGNGTDPIDVNGYQGFFIFADINDGVTLTNGFQGYVFQPHIHSGAIFGAGVSNSNIFGDFANVESACDGWTSFNANPIIAGIHNGANYNGYSCSATIQSFTGNAGFTGIGMFPQITAPNLGTGGVQLISAGGTIANLDQNSKGIGLFPTVTTGSAEWIGLDISNSSVTTTGTKRVARFATNNLLNSVNDTALEVQGRTDLQSGLLLESGLTQAYCNIIGGNITIPNGTAITGTDTIGNNMAIGVDLGDATSSWTAASVVGMTTLGFVGQIVGAGTANGAINYCLAGFAQAHTGHVDRVNNFAALAVPTGAPGTIDEHVLFYGDMPAGDFATDHWGIRIDDSGAIDIENYMTKLALGDMTSKKVANASVGLELDSTTKALLVSRMDSTAETALTAINGMIIYNTTTNKFRGYENGAWVDLV